MAAGIPHVGLAAPSGTGKTTLMTRLIPVLRKRGLRVAYLKHAHHGFDLDTPGKDTYRAREAGASAVVIASAERWALLQDSGEANDGAGLQELLARFDHQRTDLVLIEGWHGESYPKILVHRRLANREPLRLDDPDLIGIATDAIEELAESVNCALPLLPLNEPERIADFILSHALGDPTQRIDS